MTTITKTAARMTVYAGAKALPARAALCSLIVAAGLAMGSGSASAAVITLSPISFGPQQTHFNDPLSIAQYDPAANVGPLLGMILTLSTSISTGPGGSIACQTPGQVSGQCSGTITSTGTFNLTFPAFGNLTLVSTTPSTVFPYSITGVNTISIPGDAASGSATATFTVGDGDFLTPFVLAAFTGTGSATLNVDGAGAVSAANGDGFVLSGNPIQGFGTLSVTYEYAPEPASLAVLGVALTGLGAIRRRRKG